MVPSATVPFSESVRGLVAVEQRVLGHRLQRQLAGGLRVLERLARADRRRWPRAPRRCRTSPPPGCRHPWCRGRRVPSRAAATSTATTRRISTTVHRRDLSVPYGRQADVPASPVPRVLSLGLELWTAGTRGLTGRRYRVTMWTRNGRGADVLTGRWPWWSIGQTARDARAGSACTSAATSSLLSRITTLRLSLRLGVSCPPSSVHSSGRIANLRIDSALETALLASSTAVSISARRSGSSTRSATLADLPCCSAQAGERPRGRG